MRKMRSGLVGWMLVTGLAACEGGPLNEAGRGDFSDGTDAADAVEVARVDGSPIYRSDVDRAAAAQGLVPEGTHVPTDAPAFQVTLEGLVDQRLLALDAFRRGLDTTPEARRRIAVARERILGNLSVEAALAEKVTDASLRELYDAQNALLDQGPERQLRRIVVADAETARAVAERLSDEEDFAELAAEFSTEAKTAAQGGAMGWVARDALPDGLAEAVFSAPVGARLEPLEVDGAWHVVEVLDARTPGARDFDEVRDDLERFMVAQTVEGLLDDLRQRSRVSYSALPGAGGGGIDAPEGAEP